MIISRPILSRAGALAILAALVALFCVGPLAAYCGLLAANSDALATEEALLQRYRLLAAAGPNVPTAPAGALLYPEMPESQASALLQETVKSAAAAARVRVLGLQVLGKELQSGTTRVGVRVRASGDMASLRSLLYAIEAASPALYPDNLSIQSHAGSSDTVPAALDFQLDVSGFTPGPPS